MGKFSLDGDGDEGAENKSGVVTVPGVEEHAESIANASPEIQQHAIDEAARKKAEEDASIPRDDHGEPFDPKRHTGSKLKNGHWRLKKGQSELKAPKKNSAATGNGGTLVMSEAQEAQSRMAGAAAAAMMFSSLTMLMGDEWQPRTEKEAGFDEQKLMSNAFGDYFVSKNVTDFPPGVTLSFVLLGYVAARMSMPKTRTKMQKFKTWAALKFAAYKLKKEFKKAGIVAKVEIIDGVLTVDGDPNWRNKKK